MGDTKRTSNSLYDDSSFGSASASRWTYDAAAQEPDADTDHVVWQPSQSSCEALNQLLKDANWPRRSPRSTRVKTWTPSPGSATSDASFSPITPLTIAAPSSRVRRPSKRRPSNVPDTVDESGEISAPSRTLEHLTAASPSALIALIKDVSAKVDEDTKLKRQALEGARAKAQKRERDKEKRRIVQASGVSKRRSGSGGPSSAADVKGRGREYARDKKQDYQEEEMQMDAAMDVDTDAHRMPPPPTIPAPRIRSGTVTASSYAQDAKAEQDVVGSHKIADASLSPSTSFDTTFARAALSAPSTTPNPITKADPQKARPARDSEESGTKGGISTSMSSMSIVPRSKSPTSAVRASRAPPTSLNLRSNPAPAPAKPALPAAPQTREQPPNQATWKPKAPPALGMRRLGNSQTPPPSQGFGTSDLPVKQKQFRTPFAKTKPAPGPTTVPVPVRQPSSSTSASHISSMSAIRGKPAPVVPPSISVKSERNPTSGRSYGSANVKASPGGQPNDRSPDKPNHSRHQSAGAADDGRSSPAPEADISFSSGNFDNIDEDELEEVCRMFD
ncbi:hypothetical protein DFH11DRAFT_842799 [Phellopilus nigrolimitatus]|nr:hypothetical protein DFH11DRAFT_842799 [Phellopilus nigrolimitatus]